jgi:hypothetical protein
MVTPKNVVTEWAVAFNRHDATAMAALYHDDAMNVQVPHGEPVRGRQAMFNAFTAWVMNGRFVRQEFTGEFMGKPFHGVSLTGYDNTKQKYNSVWIDDMRTSMFTSEGEGENGNNVITLEGKYDCPMTGRKDLPMKQVLLIINQDKHVFEMHDPTKGDGSKTMEITYTRK